MHLKKVNVGVIGCGDASNLYLKDIHQFDILQVVACADLEKNKAADKAARYDIPKISTVKDIIEDPKIDVILNLTNPSAHAEVSLAALEAGKHVYSEKPLAVDVNEALKIVNISKAKNLMVGCAPDTFLGRTVQTCQMLVDDGSIGEPIGANAFIVISAPPETWHPNPAFFYQKGGGPLLDMGPYYLTNLIAILGPIVSVTALAKKTFPVRKVTGGPKKGETIGVETSTHIVGLIKFKNGCFGQLLTSFDICAAKLPYIEIYGAEGTISMPDPNSFKGTVQLCRSGEKEWNNVPLIDAHLPNCRGIGLADMAYALRMKKKCRANSGLAYHVLDVMHSFYLGANSSEWINVSSDCEHHQENMSTAAEK